MRQRKILVSFDLEKKYIDMINSVDESYRVEISDDPEEVRKKIVDAEILYSGSSHNFNSDIFGAAKSLRWIQAAGVGVDWYLFPALKNSHVVLTNSRGAPSDAIAEHAIALMLCLSRKIHYWIALQTKREWTEIRDNLNWPSEIDELSEKTLGLIGLGSIGRAIATRAKCLGMNVVAADPLRKQDDLVSICDLDTTLAQSDFVTVCAPLTSDTKGMIGREQFKKMKKTAYIINVSRGPIIKQDELVEALENKIIRGAALDAFEKEPLPQDSSLWAIENVIITPHAAWITPRYYERATKIFCENLRRYARGEELLNIINKQLGF
jgi:D-2-hydroxyacid dehydrogenase (NADP+)